MIILIVAGAVPLVLCIIKMKMLNAFKKKSVVADATVTKVEERYRYKTGIIYRATVEYVTDKKELYIATVPLFKKHVDGDTVRLMYMPDDPTKFSTDFGKRLPYFLPFTIVLFLLIIWLCVWLGNLEYTVQ
jgi:hypothetical protein